MSHGSRQHSSSIGTAQILIAWLVLVATVFHPTDGWKTPICLQRLFTGIPCPGCGMMRSLSCTARGDLEAAFKLHPFGPVFFALFGAIVALSLLPARVRSVVDAVVDRRRRVVRAGYVLLCASFLTFGVVRALHHMVLTVFEHCSAS